MPGFKTLFFCFLLATGASAQNPDQVIITTDLDNFWAAYDKITASNDTTEQLKLINDLYIGKGTAGLKAIMQARGYTAKGYVDAINRYPKFWKSIRGNINQSKNYTQQIKTALEKLRAVYPKLKPLPVYLTVGVFRTNGTASDGKLLLGCEMAATDETVMVDELPEYLQYFYKNYTKSLKTIDLLCVHECIHGQQRELQENLLNVCLYEGVAEFVSTKATGIPSNVPAIEFGNNNREKVFQKFEQDMFIPNKAGKWLWSSQGGDFGVRDMGYYIGYAICARYYDLAKDKRQAIGEMIELDFGNEKEIEKFVDKTRLLSKSLKRLNKDFERSRPQVVSISQFKNGSKKVSPKTGQITLNFSKPMNKEKRGFEFGPLGEANALKVKKVAGFSEDGRSFTFEAELLPGRVYQVLVSNAFRSEDGIPLKPYLINIRTMDF